MAQGNKPDYGTWVPKKLVVLLWILTALALVLSIVGFSLGWNNILNAVLVVAFFVALFFAISMTGLRWTFSYSGGRLMEKIHDFVVSKLPEDMHGKVLDVGCGSGALAINIAKKHPNAKVTGIDYWGMGWDYGKKMCESNAAIEGVTNVDFQKGDACHLDFPDESFDAVVSNFVYHEVRVESDKEKLVRETLRVLKKGGCFALHDMMEDKHFYKDMPAFIEELKKEGFQEVNYIPNTENQPYVPAYTRTYMFFKGMGLLYGRK